jgi:DNA-binding transcriptional LysR family regulator
MEMHQIRYFLAAARTLNFTQAAEECHVAQPSLSQAIKKLEEELGGLLFRRERSLTHLTDLGRMVLPLLTQCYESALAAKDLAASIRKGTVAPLRLGLSHTINIEILVQPLTELVRHYPGLELSFFRANAEEVAQALKNGDSELALAGPLKETWDRLDAYPLFTESYQLTVNKAHPFAMRNAVALQELGGERLLARSYCEQAAELADILARQGIRQRAGDRIASEHDLIALLDAGLGASIMPQSALSTERLRGVSVMELDLRRTVYLYAVAGRQRSPAASGLIKLLRAADWSHLSRPVIGEDRPEFSHAESRSPQVLE